MTKSELRSLILEAYQEVLEGRHDAVTFKAIFLVGGPGSGKSHISQKLGLEPLGFKLADEDRVYEFLIKQSGNDVANFDIGSDKAQTLRQQSNRLAGKREELFVKLRLGVIFDGTGKDYSKIETRKRMLEDVGYDTAMVFVNTDLEVAVQRNNARARKVPEEWVKAMWERSHANFDKFHRLFGESFFTIDNNTTNLDQIESVRKQLVAWAKTAPSNRAYIDWMDHTTHSST